MKINSHIIEKHGLKKDEYKISETTGLRILIGEKFDTTDPVVQKFGDTDSLKGLPEYPNNFICRPEVIVLANKIRSVCEENLTPRTWTGFKRNLLS